jgi:hypothetical protein
MEPIERKVGLESSRFAGGDVGADRRLEINVSIVGLTLLAGRVYASAIDTEP